MSIFVARDRELAELDDILAQPGNQFILVYGRRRVGKTTLLLRWVRQTGRPVTDTARQRKWIYWVAVRSNAAHLRQSFSQAVWGWAHPENMEDAPRHELWENAFAMAARLISDQAVILIMDEFSYAAEADPSLPSHLQAAWDHSFKGKKATLVLAGSHIGMMVDLIKYDAPLYGRFTAKLPVNPLPFPALEGFLPGYSIAERVAAFAVVGGVPFYLEQLDKDAKLWPNIRRLFLRRTSIFHSEPFILLGDLVRRETQNYTAVLRELAAGKRTPAEIGGALDVSPGYAGTYLRRLEEMHLVERRLPATLPLEQREKSRISRYHLADPYLQFYFRFIHPNMHLVEQELTDKLAGYIREQFRQFVGMTAFESLCREWTLVQARAGGLPLAPEIVGSHWSTDAQVDVVAVDWKGKEILLGECKWTTDPIRRHVVRELVRKAPHAVPGEDWKVHYAFFGRSGFTPAARQEAETLGALLVDLTTLNEGLRQGMESRLL